jgi:hypothetical protein
MRLALWHLVGRKNQESCKFSLYIDLYLNLNLKAAINEIELAIFSISLQVSYFAFQFAYGIGEKYECLNSLKIF